MYAFIPSARRSARATGFTKPLKAFLRKSRLRPRAIPATSGKGQVILDPSDLENSKVYAGGGGALGATAGATIDFVIYKKGEITDGQPVSKISLSAGWGYGGSATVVASETGTTVVLSGGAVVGVSGSGVIGEQFSQSPNE